jgi:hypothetical protein
MSAESTAADYYREARSWEVDWIDRAERTARCAWWSRLLAGGDGSRRGRPGGPHAAQAGGALCHSGRQHQRGGGCRAECGRRRESPGDRDADCSRTTR